MSEKASFWKSANFNLLPVATRGGRSDARSFSAQFNAQPPAMSASSRRDWLSRILALLLAGSMLAVIVGRFCHYWNPPAGHGASTRGQAFGLYSIDQASPQVDHRFDQAAFLEVEPNGRWFGTFVNADQFQGELLSTTFPLDADELWLPVLGYPNLPGNRLALEILDAAGAVTATRVFADANPTERAGVWRVPTTAWKGRQARLHLTDGLTTTRGWLAVGLPSARTSTWWLTNVPRRYGAYLLAALGLTSALFLPGLALRTWRPHWLPKQTAFLPIPGMMLLGCGGLIVWIGPRWGIPIVTVSLLGILFGLALGLVATWWRRGGPLSRSETCELAVYGCVVASAWAFAALPLEVGQEYHARTPLHGRMIASPPDAGIPYVTAAYFYEGKNGWKDREKYFGFWSVTSRGPLAPLMIACGFDLFGVKPNIDLDQAPPSWPITSNGIFVARILGILTNAWVILAGVSLAVQFRPSSRRIALVWLAVAPVTLINVDFLWPKLLAAGFLLLAVRALHTRRTPYASALACALAYYSHPVGGLFTPAVLMYAFWLRRPLPLPPFPSLAWAGSLGWATRFCLTLVACLAPWLIYKALLAQPDLLLRYPFGDGRGFEMAQSITSWVDCRLSNLWLTLTPLGHFFSPNTRSWLEGPLSEPLRWGVSYAKALPGSLGLLVFPLAAWSVIRTPPAGLSAFRSFLLWGALIVMLIFWGFSADGLGRNCLEPLAYFLIIYVVCAHDGRHTPWRLLLTVTALEALSVRAFGVIGATSFTWSECDLECTLLATVATLLGLLPLVGLWMDAEDRKILPAD